MIRNLILRFLSSINYFYRAKSVFHDPGKNVLKPAQFLDFTPAEKEFLVLGAFSSNFDHDYAQGSWQPEIAVTLLSNVTLLGNSGALVQHDRVITESVFDQRRLSLSPAWRMPALMVPKRLKGTATAIFHLPWAETSNYHWFFDCLPRLYALAQTQPGPVTFLTNRKLPAFQEETLRFVLQDLPGFIVKTIGKTEKITCENFLLPAFVVHKGGGFLPREAGDFVRENILKGYGIGPRNPTRRIFISRSRAGKRRILNETELHPILEKLGFEIVFPEELSYREQVALFFESKIIAGAHGAGLTNAFFAQKAMVLELHPANAIKLHYFLLSKGRGLEYHYLVGSAANEKLDFTVNAAAFEKKLQELTA